MPTTLKAGNLESLKRFEARVEQLLHGDPKSLQEFMARWWFDYLKGQAIRSNIDSTS